MTESIEFFVPGVPAPGGSKKAFVIGGRARITDDCKRNAPWRQSVVVFAQQAYQGEPLTGPLRVSIVFVMPRLKGHYGSGKNVGQLKANAPVWHTVKPDATKLMRSTEDALTGILWRDDATIVQPHPTKMYGDRPGAYIVVRQVSDAHADEFCHPTQFPRGSSPLSPVLAGPKEGT